MRRSAALLPLVVSFLAAMCLVRPPVAADDGLLEAIRDDDVRVVTSLLASGADPNVRDGFRATALMHAAALSSIDVMRALLKGGAEVNAASGRGATALIWAAGDAAKVELLLDDGAAVNARAEDGTSALVAAARRGNLDVMRLLLARGANPTSAANETTELLRVAFGDHPAIRQVLDEAGIDLNDLVPSGAVPLTTFPSVSDAGIVRELLEIGVSPNPRGRFPILANAVFEGHLDTAALLLDRGADPNARGQHDVTPLMMAAAATRADPAMVQLLLAKGAAIDARDIEGRSALDWALLHDPPSRKS
jgi:ankyrin repeat protein